MERLAGRYDLVISVTRGEGRTVWQGTDVVLGRDVGVLVLDRDHPRAAAVRGAASAVAQVEHQHLLRVIDADVDDGRVLVVTRWLPGATLAERLATGPLPAGQAAVMVRQVAEALAEAAELGVHHLVLDPRDVLLTDHGAVLVGTGVRAALAGVAADSDAEAVDAWRLGALLYAAVTGRWPGHPCAGLPAAPTVDGRVARPRQVRAGVTREVDEVAWRCLDPEAPQPLTTPAEVAEALTDLGDPAADDHRAAWALEHWPWARLGMAAIAAVVLVGLGMVAVAMWEDFGREPAAPASQTPSPSPTDSETGAPTGPIDVVDATAFDPAGDGEENDEEAANAVDGDPATAWRTLTYTTSDLGQLKPGVGLLLDLGDRTDVGGVELELVGRGTDLQVLVSDRNRLRSTAAQPLRGFSVLGGVQGAGDRVTLRSVEPVPTRYVLVWLTGLPPGTDGYQGGLAEAVVLR